MNQTNLSHCKNPNCSRTPAGWPLETCLRVELKGAFLNIQGLSTRGRESPVALLEAFKEVNNGCFSLLGHQAWGREDEQPVVPRLTRVYLLESPREAWSGEVSVVVVKRLRLWLGQVLHLYHSGYYSTYPESFETKLRPKSRRPCLGETLPSSPGRVLLSLLSSP